MNFIDLNKNLFMELNYTFYNLPYEENGDLIQFDTIYKNNTYKNINSEKNNNFLKSILCENIYNQFFEDKNNKINNTSRSCFVRGEYQQTHCISPKVSPKSWIQEFINEFQLPLLQKQYKRIKSLINTTAPRLSYQNTEIEENYKGVLKTELAKKFNEYFGEYIVRLKFDKVTIDNIEICIACTIFMIIFDNKDYKKNKYITDDDIKTIERKLNDFYKIIVYNNHSAKSPLVTVLENFSIPYYHNDRKEELDNLINYAFKSVENDNYQVHVITGERGIGKTLLAMKYTNEILNTTQYYHILFVTYRNSIKETICDIESVENTSNLNQDEVFLRNLQHIKSMQGNRKVLLIIDNYDNTIGYSQELSYNNSDYRKLLNTHCKILITTTLNISNSYAINNHVTNLSYLDTNKLKNIFKKISEKYNENEDKLEYLIENVINRNTYLTVLCAELIRSSNMPVENIIDLILNHRIDTADIFASSNAFGSSNRDTLMDHFCLVLNKNKIVNPDNPKEEKIVHKILFILSLLPIGGINRSDFDKICGSLNKNERAAITLLKDHHIIFYNGNNLYMQPVVMEYVIRNLLVFDDRIYNLLSILTEKLDGYDINSELMKRIRLSESVTKVFWDKEIRELIIERSLDKKINIDEIYKVIDMSCILDIRISVCYTGIDLFKQGYNHLMLMFKSYLNHTDGTKLFEIFKNRNCPAVDNVFLAKCCMSCSYAYLNIDKNSLDENIKIAQKYLEIGEDFLKDISIEGNDSIQAKIALTKLHGTQAGCYLQSKDYESALEKHTEALKERELLEKITPQCEKMQIEGLIAFSCRAIGIVHYFIAEDEHDINKKEEHYLQSYLFNKRSCEIYKEYDMDTIGSYNRQAGSALKLVSLIKDDSNLSNLIGLTFDELAKDIYDYMEYAFKIYCSCGVDRSTEMKGSLKRLITLTEMLIARNKFDNNTVNFNNNVVENVKKLETASDECLELAKKLQKLTLQISTILKNSTFDI